MQLDASGGGGTIWGVFVCLRSLINTLDRMVASSALSRNGRLYGAGMAREPETDDRGASGERREVER